MPTAAEKNKTLMRRIYDEIINKGKLALADELIATNFVEHEKFPGAESGVAGFKRFVTNMLAAFPDLRVTVEDMVADGEKVVARVAMHGTHQGEFMGVSPTRKRIDVQAIDIVRFANGKVTEHWGVTDERKLLEQLGAYRQSASAV